MEDRKELYKHMAEWDKYRRRDHVTIFEVFFKDKEEIDEAQIQEIVRSTADFFRLPLPFVSDQCEVMAKVLVGHELNNKVYYNWMQLQEAGINNADAFELILTHELAHCYFKGKSFRLCQHEQWAQELACDYMTGIRAAIQKIATGKYKYVISRPPATLTHPDGKIRSNVVEYAVEFINRMQRKKSPITLGSALNGFPRFMCLHSARLNSDWQQLFNKMENSAVIYPSTEVNRSVDMDKLPDSNLLKQALLKYKKKE